MAGIGDDILETLEELGSPITIIKVDGTEFTEFAMFESFYKDSVDSNRQFGYTGTHPYNSDMAAGDLILYMDKYLLVLNSKPTIFEQEVVEIKTYLVECNCDGRFTRFTELRDPDTLKLTKTWVNLFPEASIHALQFEKEPFVENFEGVSQLSFSSQKLYTQAMDVKVGDRWCPNDDDLTEHYKVMQVFSRKFSGCNYYILEYDTRE